MLLVSDRDEKPMFSVNELLGLREPFWQQNAALSPDGSRFAAVIHRHGYETGGADFSASGAPAAVAGAQVVMVETASGTATALIEEGNSWSPAWSPDGHRLAFVCDAGGAVRLWLWHAGSRAGRLGSSIIAGGSFGNDTPQWFPDGERLLVHLPSTQPPAQASDHQTSVDVLVHRPGVPSVQGPGVSDDVRTHRLGVVDTRSGSLSVLAAPGPWETGTLAPDGRTVALQSVARWPDLRDDALAVDVVVCKLDLAGRVEGTSPVAGGLPFDLGYGRHRPSWSPDATTLALLGDDGCTFWTAGETRTVSVGVPISTRFISWLPDSSAVVLADATARLWRLGATRADASGWPLDAQGHGVRPLVAAGAANAVVVGGSPSSVLAVTEHGDTASLIEVPLDGSPARVRFSQPTMDVSHPSPIIGSIGGISTDGQVVVWARQSIERPAQYWVKREPDPPRCLLDLNSEVSFPAVTAQRLSYVSSAGQQLGGHLLLPDAEPPFPVVFSIYPGWLPSTTPPTWDSFDLVVLPGQLLAAAGYAIATIDLPCPYLTQTATELVDAIHPAVDAVLATGSANPDCLVLAGHSAGGHAVALALSATQRFRAGIAAAPPTDLLSYFGSVRIVGPDVASLRGVSGLPSHLAPPWRGANSLDRSPLVQVDNIHTPLLLVHGTDDDAVPVGQSDELYVALTYLDRPVTYLRYRGESHNPNRFSTANRHHLAQTVRSWLAEQLGGTPRGCELTGP